MFAVGLLKVLWYYSIVLGVYQPSLFNPYFVSTEVKQ